MDNKVDAYSFAGTDTKLGMYVNLFFNFFNLVNSRLRNQTRIHQCPLVAFQAVYSDGRKP
jgi:hypothetical protein